MSISKFDRCRWDGGCEFLFELKEREGGEVFDGESEFFFDCYVFVWIRRTRWRWRMRVRWDENEDGEEMKREKRWKWKFWSVEGKEIFVKMEREVGVKN